MEVLLKKPHKLPPLKIQGRHIAGMRINDKYHPSSLKHRMSPQKREEKRQSLPTNLEIQIMELTAHELSEKERILILSLQERIKMQRKVLEDRKHMVNAIRLNFERLERLLDQKEVENKLLKLKIHELQKSSTRAQETLVLKGRSKLQNSPDKMQDTIYRKKSLQAQRVRGLKFQNSVASRESSKVRQRPSSKQFIQRSVLTKTDHSPKKSLKQDPSKSALGLVKIELHDPVEELQHALENERKLRREIEEKYEKKQKQLIKIKKELDSLLRNSQKPSVTNLLQNSHTRSVNQSFSSDGDEPELMMKKLNAKISIKKKIKKLENKIEELQRGEEEEPPSPLLEQPKRDKIKKRKSKFKYSLQVSEDKRSVEIAALQEDIRALEQQIEKLELGDDINMDDFNSTDTEDIEDYRILLENEFSTIKKVCEQKNVCTLERRELESTVQELQQRIQEKEMEWESLQEKFTGLERKMTNESKTQDEVQLLKKIVEEHESELTMVNQQRVQAEKQKKQLQTRIQLLFHQIVKSENKISSLTHNLTESEETKTQISLKYSERESEVKKLQVDLEKLNECVEQLAHTCPIYPY